MTAGTSSGSAQSPPLIPVPEPDSVVGRRRHTHDPVAAAGVPAHITLIVPWISPAEISKVDLARLDSEVSDVKAFDFELTHVDWFGRRVLWVAPEPAAPFLELTARLAERFGTPPWDGDFAEVVPHLTVAHASAGVELVPIASAVSANLPLRCRAGEIWVMVGDGTHWTRHHRTPLVQ